MCVLPSPTDAGLLRMYPVDPTDALDFGAA
jgi:hypothetical protein